MMKSGTRGVVAAAIVCLVATALPVAAGAATSAKCSSSQLDIGGTCTSKKEVAQHIVSITNGVMKQYDAKGVVMRVDVGNDTIVNTGLGLSQEGVKVTPNMSWRPGSMAIPMLTSIALQLQQQGKLSLDDTLSKWYPDYPNADKVTLRQMSSVTSGYPDFIQENPPFQAAQSAEPFRHWTDDELLKYAFALPVVCDPGTCFHYAHTNFILLGNVLQKITGKTVTELIQTKFLDPLGMTQTKITKEPAIPEPALHAYTDERGPYEESTGWSPSWGLGDGLIMTSTARDMTTLVKAIGTGKFLSKQSVNEQFQDLSKGLPGAPPQIGYGLGIATAGTDWVLQNPVFNGYQGIAAYERGQKLSIVIDNTQGPKADPTTSIASEIYKALAAYLAPNDPISTTTPTGAALAENVMLGLDRVEQEFPELTKIGKTGPDETAIDNPMASRAVFYTDESGEKKVTISVSQYQDVAAAKKAWGIAVKASKDAPGGKSTAAPQLGEEAFAGTSQVGDEMHFGLGFRDGRLIIAGTFTGLPVTDDNSNKLITLAGEELTAAKAALGDEAAG